MENSRRIPANLGGLELPTHAPGWHPAITDLAAKSEEEWGDPVKNRDRLIPTGIKPIDAALFGGIYRDFGIIQGAEKSRKTTTMLNMVRNMMLSDNKPRVSLDTLESAMRPSTVKDMLISMQAASYLYQKGHTSHKPCKICGGDCRELIISPRFLMFGNRSRLQKEAIDYALESVNSWPLLLFGPSITEGQTRNLPLSIQRWKVLVEEYGMQLIISDHLQQIFDTGYGHAASDYEKLQAAIPPIATFVAEYSHLDISLIALSQVSLTSRREAGASGKLIAKGGAKAAAEASLVLSTRYQDNVVQISIDESRFSGNFSVWHYVDVSSGLFVGDPSMVSLVNPDENDPDPF